MKFEVERCVWTHPYTPWGTAGYVEADTIEEAFELAVKKFAVSGGRYKLSVPFSETEPEETTWELGKT